MYICKLYFSVLQLSSSAVLWPLHMFMITVFTHGLIDGWMISVFVHTHKQSWKDHRKQLDPIFPVADEGLCQCKSRTFLSTEKKNPTAELRG